jgi:hypothetical protein
MQTINQGAPLDVAFINELVNTVERLVADSNSSQYKRTTVKDGIGNSSATVRTADARIYAETFILASAVGLQKDVRAQFELPLTNFNSTPVVTVTPVLDNAGQSNVSISVVITHVSSTRVVGYAVANNTLPSSQRLALSLVAIGIPTVSAGTATQSITSTQ